MDKTKKERKKNCKAEIRLIIKWFGLEEAYNLDDDVFKSVPLILVSCGSKGGTRGCVFCPGFLRSTPTTSGRCAIIISTLIPFNSTSRKSFQPTNKQFTRAPNCSKVQNVAFLHNHLTTFWRKHSNRPISRALTVSTVLWQHARIAARVTALYHVKRVFNVALAANDWAQRSRSICVSLSRATAATEGAAPLSPNLFYILPSDLSRYIILYTFFTAYSTLSTLDWLFSFAYSLRTSTTFIIIKYSNY